MAKLLAVDAHAIMSQAYSEERSIAKRAGLFRMSHPDL